MAPAISVTWKSQLQASARLEAIMEREYQATDLAQLCEEVVGAVAPWVLARGDTIAFEEAAEP